MTDARDSPDGPDASHETETETDEAATAASATGDGPPDDEPAAEEPNDGSRDLVRYLSWAALGVLGLLTVIATFRFYTSTSRAIGRLVSPEYEPLFQAAFNLVVVLVALAGISLLVRRLVVEG